MNIWVVTIGEPIINNKSSLRLHRSGILSKYISENSNHNVTWWTSCFNHFLKEFEFDETTSYFPNKNLNVIAIKGFGYKKNISLSRIIDHYIVSKKFLKISKNFEKPDIIICSFPTMGLTKSSIIISKKHGIPLLLDYRDMWPDAFEDIFPDRFKKINKILVYPLHIYVNKLFNKADGIIGITEAFLNLGLKKVKRSKNLFDAHFPLGYKKIELKKSEVNVANDFWKSKFSQDNKINICFIGTLGHQFDLFTLIDAFNKCKEKNKFRIIICGSGDNEVKLRELSKNNENIIFPGYINAIQIKQLLRISHFGLCPYIPKEMFLKAIPGKIIEYFSEGLPIITTLGDGIVGEIVNRYKYGINYEAYNSKSILSTFETILHHKDNFLNKKKLILDYFDKNFNENIVFKDYLKHIEAVVDLRKKSND